MKSLLFSAKKTLINNFSVLIGAFSFYAFNSYNDSLKSWILMPAISMFCITVLLCFFDLKSKTENADKEIKIISCISCIGILLFYSKKFYNNFGMQQSWIDSIVDFSRTSKNIFVIFLIMVLCVLSILFILPFLKYIYFIIKESLNKLFMRLHGIDLYIFFGICILSMAFTVLMFSKTDVLYNAYKDYCDWDYIYTSDTLAQLGGNIWLNLWHTGNCIVHPTFSSFSMPLVAPLYLLSQLFVSLNLFPYFLAFLHTFLICTTYTMIIDLMEFKHRGVLLLLYFSLYSSLLFSFVIEEYIIVFFWLILFIYNYIKKENHENCDSLLIISTSTILTNGILALLLIEENKSIKNNFLKLIKLFFLGALTVFSLGNSSLSFTFLSQIKRLSDFSGIDIENGTSRITLIDKFYQYTNFVKSCFVFPKASIKLNAFGCTSWQLDVVDCASVIGIVIFVLCIISFIINRKDKLCQISFGWIVYSVFVLLIVGWGTVENGLILYSLYFTWAFAVLLIKLIQYIFNALKIEKVLPYLYTLIAVFLYVINIKDILNMINQMAEYYPK